MQAIQALVTKFTEDLTGAFHTLVSDAIKTAGVGEVAAAPKKRGRPPGSKSAVVARKAPVAVKAASKARKPADPNRYRCPVPKCTGKAAPIFGMVCAKHKDLPKAVVKKHRAALAAAKEKAKKK